MYFNIEINILDQYSSECEKVHMLVFISYLFTYSMEQSPS